MTEQANREISKVAEDTNNTINQLNFIDIYRTLQPTTADYMLSLSIHETLIMKQ